MAINFPDSPTTNDLFTSGGKTWEYDGTAWTIKAATTSIATGSITYDKLAADAVTTVKIADGAITAAKIADGTVVAAEIASSAITTVKINDAAVTTAKINDAAVTTGKINDSAVTTAKILDSNVTTAKINDAAVTTAKVNDSAVTTAKINDAAVTQAKLGTTLSAVTVTTAANRDTAVASPFTGQLVFLTDTKKIQVWDGTSWLNITLAPPETPTSLSATALSTTSVSISFTAGGANGSPITNYKYALSTDSGSTYGSFVAVDPADITTPITISGLTAATAYYIKLKAVNDMGDSVASAAVSISTLATPDAPTSLSAGSITASSADISFTAGSDNGYAISNYQYALSTDSGSTYGSFTALSPADFTTPITITGLTQGTAYYIKIKGVNSGGAGAESSAVSFTTLQSVTVNYLVVAGAGGGGARQGGGGGAGGLRSTVTSTGGGGSLETALALSLSTNYTVTVGAGGAAGPLYSSNGVSGSNSVFSTITSISGGYGGGESKKGDNGGSGGGSAWAYNNGGNSGLAAATGTPNQGFDGGKSSDGTAGYGAGGGGGAGAVGATGSYSAGVGGVGVAVAITGSSVTYGGGGGGGGNTGAGVSPGSGGSGGGGSGSTDNATGTAGTDNFGAGGGGGGVNGAGGAGGSGIVILRYPNTKTITLGAGLTGTTATVSSDKVTTITAGTGNVSWA